LCAVSNPGFLEAFSIALTPEKVTAFNKDERIEKMVYNLIPLEQHIILNTSKEQRKALQHEKVMRDLNSDEHGQKGHIQSVMRKLEQARGFIEKHKADLHTYVGSDGIVKYEHPNSKYQVEQKGTMAFKLQHCEQNLKKLEEACAKQLEQVDQKINDVSSNKLGWSSKNVKNFGLLGSVFVSGLGLGGFFGWLYSKKRA
jgi:predicted RNA-binding protein with PIN domain